MVQLLHGMAPERVHDLALTLAAMLMQIGGEKWLDSGCDGGSGSGQGRDREPGAAAALVLRLGAAELRLTLDEAHALATNDAPMGHNEGYPAQSPAAASPEPSCDNSTNNADAVRAGDSQLTPAQLITRRQRVSTMLPVCLGIIESIIGFLCDGVEDDGLAEGGRCVVGSSSLALAPPEVLLRMSSALTDAMAVSLEVKRGRMETSRVSRSIDSTFASVASLP